MQEEFNLDSFAALLKSKILAGKESPTELRKWVRKQLNVGKSRGNEFYRKVDEGINKSLKPVEVVNVGKKEFEVNGNSATATVNGVKNLQELIAYTGIDENIWECVKQKSSISEGKGWFSAEFKKKVEEIQSRNLLDIFIEEANRHAPVKFAKSPDNKAEKKLMVFNAADVHFNKMGSKEETGYEDYNLEIAVRIFNETVDALIDKTLKYGKVSKTLFVIGNDLLNADYVSGTTSVNLTPQDNDQSWFKAYTTVCRVMTETIEKFSTLGEVDILVCMGNHCMHSSFSIGEYLQAWFRNNPAIQVLNEPKMRKYYRFEKNAFLVSHGHGEKTTDLPLIFATECEFWSECPNREVYGHHFHHQSVKEDKGVVMRVFPSLAGVDRYHHFKGYIQNRRIGQALIYNETGLDALFEYRPKL